MLRLNVRQILGIEKTQYNSNTTNVKVKCSFSATSVLLLYNSNTTNVKVKFEGQNGAYSFMTDSNTTNVKVK